MPRLEAVVEPLAGKNRLKLSISQIEHKMQNVFLPLSILKGPLACD